MEWTLLVLVAALWLLSPFILLIVLIVTRQQLRQARLRLAASPLPDAQSRPGMRTAPAWSASGGNARCAPVDLENLLLLRLELQRLLESGALSPERGQSLNAELDRVGLRHLDAGGMGPDDTLWQQRRALAWSLLGQMAERPLGPAPWLPAVSVPTPVSAPTPAPEPSSVPDVQREPPVSPRLELEPQAPLPPPRPLTQYSSAMPWPAPASASASASVDVPEITPVESDNWRPAAPSPLEKALQVLSGWPRLIAPFLAQNIGWFIGGFCFLAGALFLIAHTEGFVNALVVFTSLFSFSTFLLWAGYQFRRQRPELVMTSGTLLTLAMLLGPLDLLVAVRLIEASAGNRLLLLIGGLVALLTLVAFAWMATLSSALMDRALSGPYARLLAALAAVQLAAPLAEIAPDWRNLALLHGVLLALLGYGLHRFSREWLRRLFVDRWLTSYYAAGLLVYTAAVSCVHLTWIWPTPLPTGYAGPVLMVLCVLLFRVDAAFKDWANKSIFLSRFSFALYGLSAVAVAIAVQATPAALVTLTLGALLYGWMTWQYRTWPPLYLLLGCVAGLYGFGILQPLPLPWQALASLPGLLAVLALARWAGPRSPALAWQCLGLFGVLLIGLTGWSLFWGQPGVLASATALAAAVSWAGATQLVRTLPDADPRWLWANAGVMLLSTLAVAYAPVWMDLDWALRTAFGLLALAVLWAGWGLHNPGRSLPDRALWILGARVNVVVALALGGWALSPDPLGRPEAIVLLTLAALLLLWLSLALRQQGLFYAMLLLLGLAGVLVKLGYFPAPGSGLMEFVLVLALWLLLWRLDWRAQQFERVRKLLADTAEPGFTLTDMVRVPLRQAMTVLWGIGLLHLGLRLLEGLPGPLWPWSALLALLGSLLLIGSLHQFRWMVLPFGLGLAGLLVELVRLGVALPGLGVAAMLYALLVWRLSVTVLAKPVTGRLAGLLGFSVPGGADGARQVEESLQICALLTAALPVALVPALGVLGWPVLDGMPTLLLAGLLFSIAGHHYRSAPHAVAALVTVTVSAWSVAAWWTPLTLFALGQPVVNGVLSLLMALAALGLERERAEPLAYWRQPLQGMAGLLFALALGGTVRVALTGDPGLTMLLVLLCITLFPVARPWPNAAQWRGLGLALLLGGLLASLLAPLDLQARDLAGVAILWGYGLWFAGNLLLPRWNARWPDWAVAPTLWPLLGLVGVLRGVIAGVVIGTLSPAAGLGLLALYLFLLLRNSAWIGLGWLMVAALAFSGLLAVGMPSMQVTVLAAALLWINLLCLLGTAWRWRGAGLAHALGWRRHDLDEPLFWIPLLLLSVLLLAASMLEGYSGWLATPGLLSGEPVARVLLLVLTVLTASHACLLRPAQSLPAHLLLLALALLFVSSWRAFFSPSVALPLALALWHGLLLLVWRYGAQRWSAGWAALRIWLDGVLLLALLVLPPGMDWTMMSLTLAVLALALLARGIWQGEFLSLQGGLLLGLAASYAVWLSGRDTVLLAVLGAVTPWWALQTVLLWRACALLERALTARVDAAAEEQRAGLLALERALAEIRHWLLALVVLALGSHGYALLIHRAGWGRAPWWLGLPADALAVAATLLLLAGCSAWRAWRRVDEPGALYLTALLLGVLFGYVRLLLLGLAPFAPLDTAALLLAAYSALLLYQLSGRLPLYRLALCLPLLAWVTVPWQWAAPWTGATLLASAVLYLSLATRLRHPGPLYLGVLALNGAVYLWAPLWVERYGLWQFYIIPAAVSVLALLHLHRNELRPSVLNGARLAALSALYVGAGLDVVLRPELSVFVLALALALLGVLAGIALRIRAFLYAGVVFLVLNVAGQLLRFYADQSMGRALILLGLGAVITAGMVVFNLQREAILRRVRILRADLAAWE